MRKGVLLAALIGLGACHDMQGPTAAGVPGTSEKSLTATDAPLQRMLSPASIQDYDGDHPLTTMKVVSGRVDALMLVVPHFAIDDPTGTFSVSSIPEGATVRAAFFVTTSFSPNLSETADLTFGGQSLGQRADRFTDPIFPLLCRAYPYDVTSIVTKNGTYTYSVTGTINTYGDALVIVYEQQSLPQRRVAINFGSEGLSRGESKTSFAGFGAGSGRLLIFTQADNPDDFAAETVGLNGAVIAGPGDIFNANQGKFASLQDLHVTLSAGTNTVNVTTLSDFFGLHLAILIGRPR